MKNSLQILFFLIVSILKGQDVNKLANISFKLENEKEIRIYKGRGISNGGQIFRVYQGKDKNWKAELIQWFLPARKSEDEFEIIPARVIKLTSKTPLELVFLNIEALDIEYLPKEELFEYKKSKNEVVFDKDENDYVLMSRRISVLDGKDFLVKYKSNKKENEFDYSNPENYLNKYPGIDEYESFMKILKYVEDSFNIKLN
jgi:hypothetical protein